MAVASRGRGLELPGQWKNRETSPERTKVWTETKPKASAERKVPVVYYLSRNGHLEHPHFMEVTLSPADGLYLRDVIHRLNYLRGKGMASMYSWSSKRSYKNGFVWHDLSEDDLIQPVQGHEYVLKGSELLQGVSSCPQDTCCAAASSSSEKSLDIPKSIRDDNDSALIRRKKKQWNSFDLNEYRVYKAESTLDAAVKAADAATQTDDRRQSRRGVIPGDRFRGDIPQPEGENPTIELGRDEISPPPSSSSPETLETLIKADVRAGGGGGDDGGACAQDPDQAEEVHPSGRVRASAVLMHLISCGSLSVKDHRFSLVSQYRARLPRGGGGSETSGSDRGKDTESLVDRSSFPALTLEDKEYFSGSLIETKKKASDAAGGIGSLMRSSSFNAGRCSKIELAEKEIDGVRAKCIPRRPPRSSITRKDSGTNKGSSSSRSSEAVKQQMGEKRTS